VPEPRPIAPGLFVTTDDGPRLLAGRCAACNRLHFPSASSCTYCGGTDCSVQPVGPSGSLFLFTEIRTAPAGYRGPIPYGFGVVELAEGLRVITRLTGTSATTLRPGIAMRLVITTLCTDDDQAPVLSYGFEPCVE
jgi:uncharacterized OB-fold protein